LAFATFLVWRLRIGVCGVGAYDSYPFENTAFRFSELGAAQLLEDFSGVGAWLQSMTGVLNDEEVNRALLRHEVLRRCEGVARLLLRRPGERIAMTDETAPAQRDADGSPEMCMPAEMYVPNQEKWLRLRASRRNTMCCAPVTSYM